jgi:hypothetical protein
MWAGSRWDDGQSAEGVGCALHCVVLSRLTGLSRTTNALSLNPPVSGLRDERQSAGRAGVGVVLAARFAGSGALLVEDLLAQDVGVPAVLGELPQQVEVHPAQRQRAPPVTGQQVVQIEGGRRAAR